MHAAVPINCRIDGNIRAPGIPEPVRHFHRSRSTGILRDPDEEMVHAGCGIGGTGFGRPVVELYDFLEGKVIDPVLFHRIRPVTDTENRNGPGRIPEKDVRAGSILTMDKAFENMMRFTGFGEDEVRPMFRENQERLLGIQL